MAEVDVTVEIVIDCPRDQVAAYAANPDNVPQWYVNIKMAPFMSFMMRRATNKDLACLKQLLENSPHDSE